jgi:hypothetical protein
MENYKMYDLGGTYKRCGHKLQSQFGITSDEFQAARKIGKKEILRDILDWIKESRSTGEQSKYASTPQEPTEPRAEQGTVLVRVPTEKLKQVMEVLGMDAIG